MLSLLQPISTYRTNMQTSFPSCNAAFLHAMQECFFCERRHAIDTCCCGIAACITPSLYEVGKSHVVCGRLHTNDATMCHLSLYQGASSLTAIGYSFWAEWDFRHRRQDTLGSTQPHATGYTCNGVSLQSVSVLKGWRYYGTHNMDFYKHNVGLMEDCGLPVLSRVARLIDSGKLPKEVWSVPACMASPRGVHSPFCPGITPLQGQPCNQCNEARKHLHNRRLVLLMDRIGRVQHSMLDFNTTMSSTFKTTPNSSLSEVEVRVKLDMLIHERRTSSNISVSTSAQLPPRAKMVHDAIQAKLPRVRNIHDFMEVCTDFVNAHSRGALQERGCTVVIIANMLQGLVHTANNKSRHGMRYDKDIVRIFVRVLLNAGPRVHNFISELLHGPHVRTTQRHIAKCKLGDVSEWCDTRFCVASDIVEALGLTSAPHFLVEDSTALIPHVDVRLTKTPLRQDTAPASDAGPACARSMEYVILMHGSVDGPIRIGTWEDLRQLQDKLHRGDAKGLELATLLHVYVLVPLVEGTPSIVVAAWLQDGRSQTYNTDRVVQHWKDAHKALATRGVCVLGFGGDGASPFRAATFRYMQWPTLLPASMDGLRAGKQRGFENTPFAKGSEHDPTRDGPQPMESDIPRTQVITVPCPLVQLVAPVVPGVKGGLPCVIMQDFLHIMWRLRRQLLQPSRYLVVFGQPANAAWLMLMEAHGLSDPTTRLGLKYNDLNPKDKTNYDACLRLFDFKREQRGVHKGGKSWTVECVLPTDTIRRRLALTPEYRGLWWYLEFCHRFTRLFLVKGLDPREIAYGCGWCLSFLGYWHLATSVGVKANTLSMAKNFITMELWTDIASTLNSMLLLLRVYHDHFPHVRFTPGRLSTKYCEHTFQGLRYGVRNNNPRTYANVALNHLALMQGEVVDKYREAGSNVPPLRNKRGQPESCAARDESWDKQDTHAYYPDTNTLCQRVEQGALSLVEELKRKIKPEYQGPTFASWSTLGKRPCEWHELCDNHHLLQVAPTTHAKKWRTVFAEDNNTHGVDAHVMPDINEYSHEYLDGFVEDIMDTCIDDPWLGMDDVVRTSMEAGVDDAAHKDDTTLADAYKKYSTHLKKEKRTYNDGVRNDKELPKTKLEQCHIGLLGCMRDALDGHLKGNNDAQASDGHRAGVPEEVQNMLRIAEGIARDMNGRVKPRVDTRTGTRFLTPEIWCRPDWEGDNALVECEDCVAVAFLYEDGCRGVEYGRVERCDHGSGKTCTTVHVLRIDDEEGKLYITWFVPMLDGRGAQQRDKEGRAMFNKPVLATSASSEPLSMEAVLCTVAMTLCSGRWVLSRDDEKAVLALSKKTGAKKGGSTSQQARV